MLSYQDPKCTLTIKKSIDYWDLSYEIHFLKKNPKKGDYETS